jgi:CHAT domain-containing protein
MGDNNCEGQLRHLKLPELTIIARNVHIKHIKSYKKEDLIRKITETEQQLQHEEENKNLAEIFPFEDDVIVIPKKRKREIKVKCEECGEYIKEKTINLHKARHNRERDFTLIEIAYKGRLTTYQHNNEENLYIENTIWNQYKNEQQD